MTVAEQREIFRRALALPEKARWDLYNRPAKPNVKAAKRAKSPTMPGEVLSKKEWNEAWKVELEKRIADIESGKVKCIPHAEVRKKLDRILGRA